MKLIDMNETLNKENYELKMEVNTLKEIINSLNDKPDNNPERNFEFQTGVII